MVATRYRLVLVLLLATVFIAACAVSLAQAQPSIHDGCQTASTWSHAAPLSVTDVLVAAGPAERGVAVQPSLVAFGAPRAPLVMVARSAVIEPLAPRAPPA